MGERTSLKNQELKFLSAEYKKHPELFLRRGFVEGPEELAKIGIYIKGKEAFSAGFLKFWPQDFIVEEEDKDGKICSIDYENLLGPETQIEKPALDSAGRERQITIYATLVKCNISTFDAIAEMAKDAGCDIKQIQYAGIKDNNAITAQRISFRGISLENLKKISSPHFFLKDISAGKGVVEKGGLRGNKFTIFVRTEEDVYGDEKKKKAFLENLEKIKKHGFHNFFYLQRFGTPRLLNYRWAYSILRGDYSAAVYDYLSTPSEGEMEYVRMLRKKIGENFYDWAAVKKIIEPMPLIFQNEIKVVNFLIGHPDDFAGALAQIPEQVTLWTYALASWFFNQEISACAKDGVEPPKTLPMFLSLNRDDWMVYEKLLKQHEIYPPPFQNLKPFNILLRSREISTHDFAEIHNVKIVPHGIILQFSLGKGQYATTFLSHLFNLIGGAPGEKIGTGAVDTKAELGEAPAEKILGFFKSTIRSKSENIFEEPSGE